MGGARLVQVLDFQAHGAVSGAPIHMDVKALPDGVRAWQYAGLA